MKNVEGSEQGTSNGIVYETSEIKICPKCGVQMLELYRCQKLLPTINLEEEFGKKLKNLEKSLG